jgi:hypothetical protein
VHVTGDEGMNRFTFVLAASIGLCGEEVRAAFVTLGSASFDSATGDSQVTSPFNQSTSQAQWVHEGSLFPNQIPGTHARTRNGFRNTSPYGSNHSPYSNDFRTDASSTATAATLTSSFGSNHSGWRAKVRLNDGAATRSSLFGGNHGDDLTVLLDGASAQTLPPSGDRSGFSGPVLFDTSFVDAPTDGESLTTPFVQLQPNVSDVTLADRERPPLPGGTVGAIEGTHTPTVTFVGQQDTPISQSEADFSLPVTANPEPASLTLLGIGGAFGLLGYRLRCRKAEATPTAAA